ncbi:MAG: acetylxylan esterase [Myxococcales bacterium]|nr:acetylxylan esterase [Myxococcales bacterium]
MLVSLCACADGDGGAFSLNMGDAEADGIDWLDIDDDVHGSGADAQDLDAGADAGADAGVSDAGEGDVDAEPDILEAVPGDPVCGGLTVYTSAAFGNVCVAPESPVNTLTLEELAGADYNALDNTQDRHIGQCQTLTAKVEELTEFQAWQALARSVLRQTLRVDAEIWRELPLDIREFEVEEFDGYTRRKIDYLVSPDQRIPAWLYIPNDTAAPRPAILFYHGHDEGGKDAAAGIDPYTEEANYHRAAARRLAEAGFIVLAPDIRSFGETGTWAEHERFSQILHLEGRTPYGVFVADAMRGMDVIERLPYVDPNRIGAVGVSMGALITVFMGVLDERVAVTSAHGILGEFNSTLPTNRHDPCLYIPYFDRLFDIADIALMGAPRPAYFVTGETDRFYPPDAARRAFERVQAGYALIGDANLTGLHVHDAGHLYLHEPSLAFLMEHLGDPGPPGGAEKGRPNGSGASSPDESDAPSGTFNPPDPNEIYAARSIWPECAEAQQPTP